MKLTCPSKSQLREFLEGAVSDAEADEISDHVGDCSSCDGVLSTLENEQGDVLNELRNGLQFESLLVEPELQQLRNTARLPQIDKTTTPDVQPSNEKRIRDYRLVRKIGEGGMGTVYQAIHVHLGKSVALKILPVDKLQSQQSVDRFRQEMRAVGRVNHPNVVSASDAGTVDGQHFLVMELVEGADLDRIIHDRGPLDVADACEIVRQAALALQHAHDERLVHRDVKPSNIMLAVDGSVKLLDLGLAGLNNSEVESANDVIGNDRLTSFGQIMGTLDYMAPEQITASPLVDGRADVYALGATLFQLLTGRTPCGDRSEETPERIEAVLHNPPLDITSLRSDVSEELGTLLLKMLAKSADDRPQTASDVASALEIFSSDSDLVALAEACRTSLDIPSADIDVTDDVSFVVPQSAALSAPKEVVNVRRPKMAVALLGFVSLLAAIVYYIQTDKGIVRVEVLNPTFKVTIAGQTVTVKEGSNKPIELRPDEHDLVVKQGDTELVTDAFELRRNDKVAFKVQLLKGDVVITKDGKVSKSMPFPGKKPVKPVATKPDSTPMSTVPVRVLSGQGGKLTFSVMTPDGRWSMTGADDNIARIWDLKSKQETPRFVLKGHKRKVTWVSVSEDGKRAATASYDGTARVWDLTTQQTIAVLPAGRTGSGALYGEKGRSYDVSLNCVALSPNGRWVVTGDIRMTAILWDMNADEPEKSAKFLERRETTHFNYEGSRRWVQISPDGKWVATGSGDHVAQLWNLQAEDPTASPIVLKGHKRSMVNKVMFSGDSRWVATGGWDEFAQLWDLKAAEPAASPIVLSGLKKALSFVRFSANSARVFVGDIATVHMRELNSKLGTVKPIEMKVDKSYLRSVVVSPTGNWVRTIDTNKKVQLWDLNAAEPGSLAKMQYLKSPPDYDATAVRRFVTMNDDAKLRWWEMRFDAQQNADKETKPTAKEKSAISKVLTLSNPKGAHIIAMSDDHKSLAVAWRGERIQLWDVAKNQAIAPPARVDFDCARLGFARQRSVAYTMDFGGKLRLWDTRTGKLIGEPLSVRTGESSGFAPDFSPKGDLMVMEGKPGCVQFWDLSNGKPTAITQPIGTDRYLNDFKLSSDGKWCLVQTRPPYNDSNRRWSVLGYMMVGSTTVWDPKTGKKVAGPFTDNIDGFVYSAKNQFLMTFENDKDEIQSEAVIRFTGDQNWPIVRRIKVPARAALAKWIDDDRLLILGSQKGVRFGKPGEVPVVYVLPLNEKEPKISVVSPKDYFVRDVVLTHDGQHWVGIDPRSISCWKIGDKKPLWTRDLPRKTTRRRLLTGDGDWVMFHVRGGPAIVFTQADGEELLRKDKVTYAETKGPYVLICDDSGAEVWRDETSSSNRPAIIRLDLSSSAR
ncbi:MAG: hypothetical protein CMJ78_14615 [Planctomycetaceae bacterium]|nr:hypothetical protein [Planctomycetaceae bacterium]